MIDESAFILSDAQKNEICTHLTPIQKRRALTWMRLQETLNKGDFVAMDDFFDPDFTYGNRRALHAGINNGPKIGDGLVTAA
jgi:hypothetical protein